MLRTIGAVAATALVLAAVPAISATADVSDRAGKPKVTLSIPANVVEGDQFTVVVKVDRADGAKQVQLEQQIIQTGGERSWRLVAKTKAKHKKKYEFHAVGGEADTLTYRARVVFRGANPVTSNPSASTVWHWTLLRDFDPYSHSSGVSDNGISSA